MDRFAATQSIKAIYDELNKAVERVHRAEERQLDMLYLQHVFEEEPAAAEELPPDLLYQLYMQGKRSPITRRNCP
jgi:hypothetical protein